MISQELIKDIEEFITKLPKYTNNLTGNEGLKTILANLNEAGSKKYEIISLKVHVEYEKENVYRLERGLPPIPISTRQGYIEVAKVYKSFRKRNYNEYVKHKHLSKTFNTPHTRTIMYWAGMERVLGVPLDSNYCFERVLESIIQKSVANKILDKVELALAIDKTKEEYNNLVQKALDDIKIRLKND